MFIKLLRAKIHRATVTETDPDYVGSITIDAHLLKAAGIHPNEVVLVADIDNGNRFETYVLAGEPGSGVIGLNGAAARLVNLGDKVIIFAHAFLPPERVADHESHVVVVDASNRIAEELRYTSKLPEGAGDVAAAP